MKVVYASLMGKTESLIKKLGVTDAVKIEDGSEKVSDSFLLFTPTAGSGEVPEKVGKFLNSNGSNLKAVLASGSAGIHPDTFAFAADVIAKKYNVPVLYKVDGAGNDCDVVVIKKLLAFWMSK